MIQYTQSHSKFCARLDAGARFCLYRWSSTLSFTVDSSLGVLVPYVSPHDLYHALTYQQNDFQRFWGQKIEGKNVAGSKGEILANNYGLTGS